MTRLLAKSIVLALAGLLVAAVLSLTAFGSAGKNVGTQPSPPRTKPVDAGGDCTGSSDVCVRGARCTASLPDGKKFVCLPVAKLGEACGPATGGCEDPAFCDDTLHCVLGRAGLGRTCALHAECKAPLVCPWARRVCSTPAKIGQSCHTNPGGRSECEAGSGCNGTRCVTQKADGQSCFADEECKAGFCQRGGCGRGAGSAREAGTGLAEN